MRAWALLGVALLGAALPGCALPPGVGEHDLADVHGFTARLERADASRATLVLDGPVAAPDRDLVLRRAYRLGVTEQPPEGPPFPPRTYYLDAGLRVVAVEDACVGARQDCANVSTTTWSAQGALPPYGVGLPAILSTAGSLVSFANRTPVAVPHTLWSDGGRVVLDVQLVSGIGLEGVEPGPLSYDGGQWVPSGGGQTVTDYVRGPALEKADGWPLGATSLPAAAWRGRMFPGEEADDFGVGFAHVAFLDALENATGGPVAGGRACVLAYHLGLSGPARANASSATAELFVLGEDGLVARHEVRAMREADGTARFETALRASFPTDATCAQARRSPWPAIDSAAFARAADAIPLSVQEPLRFSFQVGLPRFLAPRAPEQGWHTFSLFWVPAYAQGLQGPVIDYTDYQVTMDAHTGWLESATAHPSDLRGRAMQGPS